MVLSRRLRPLALLLVLLPFGSCSEPPKSLRTLMLQQELAVIALEKGAGELGAEELLKQAERIAVVSKDDAAFSNYEKRSSVRNRVSEFRALRERYLKETEAVHAAASQVDRDALLSSLTRLRATCDGCHVQFRPGL